MRWIWLVFLVGCSGSTFAPTELAADAGRDVTADAVDELAAADVGADAVDELAADVGADAVDELAADVGAELDQVDAVDELAADVGAELERDAATEAEAEAGPPPLICKSIDGLSMCESTGPWPYLCCRASPCECCNLPNCGR